MLVTRTNLKILLAEILEHDHIAIDTETTGLYPYHGDHLFSISMTTDKEEYYFNFNEYPSLPSDLVLTPQDMEVVRKALIVPKTWIMHRASYDLAILANDRVYLNGHYYCTKSGARIQYNEHTKYSLADCGERIGVKKDMAVENYIKKNKLYTLVEINGEKIKKPRYDLVPFELISKYAMQDARVTYELWSFQTERVKQKSYSLPINKNNPLMVLDNEVRLQKTLHRMEQAGVKVDLPFCKRAITHYQDEIISAEKEFTALTGREFILSGKVFEELFQDEKSKWGVTEKGNPSFDGDILKTLEHPAAKAVCRYKEAKSQIDFFHNFLHYADKDGTLHTVLEASGTRTGRFSSHSPNLQNLKKDEGDELKKEFVVRRVLVPREGHIFVMIDKKQMEYRLMLDYANAKELVAKVAAGEDVHQATADIAKCTRSQAKQINFGILYGQGIKNLAKSLGTSEYQAKQLQNSIFDAAPEIKQFIRSAINIAESRGFVFNWFGRICYFPKRDTCYKAPNTLIQGGCADIMKVAMNRCDEFLLGFRTKLVLNIHDELVFEVPEGEEYIVPQLAEIMKTSYPHKHLPMDVDIEFSRKSLADKLPWKDLHSSSAEARDEVQGENLPTAKVPAKDLGREDSASGYQGNP